MLKFFLIVKKFTVLYCLKLTKSLNTCESLTVDAEINTEKGNSIDNVFEI